MQPDIESMSLSGKSPNLRVVLGTTDTHSIQQFARTSVSGEILRETLLSGTDLLRKCMLNTEHSF